MPRGIYKHKLHTEEWKKRIGDSLRGKRHRDWKGEKPKCECGKTLSAFHVKQCIKCFHKNRIGENHPLWINDRTEVMEKHRLRSSSEWKIWRGKVFERDKYTCRECGATGVYLEPHHIRPIRTDKKQIFNIKNGITLCRQCHIKTLWKESNFVDKYSALVVA